MINKSFKLMGTNINLILERYYESNSVLEYSYKVLKDYETRFSLNDQNSMLNKINKNAGIKPVKVDKDLFYLIKAGKKASLDTDLKFNIAIGSLVRLWNIGFKNPKVPSQKEIDRCLNLIDPKCIELDEDKKQVFLVKKHMILDLGAIAKGYFADEIKKIWLKNNIKNGLIDLGRNIYAIGGSKNNNFKHWTIGVQEPFQKKKTIKTAIELSNKTIVTSGIYEKYFIKDKKNYHHILDSKTGYPVNTDVQSVSIIANSSLEAEILTTSLMSLKAYQIIDYVQRLKNTDAIVIDNYNKIYHTVK